MKRFIKAASILALVIAIGVLISDQAAAQSKGTGNGQRGSLFVDNDGDGICDNFKANSGTGVGKGMGMKGRKFGPGDGTGFKGVGPKDGTGNGAGNQSGTGICDTQGPKGYRGGKK